MCIGIQYIQCRANVPALARTTASRKEAIVRQRWYAWWQSGAAGAGQSGATRQTPHYIGLRGYSTGGRYADAIGLGG